MADQSHLARALSSLLPDVGQAVARFPLSVAIAALFTGLLLYFLFPCTVTITQPDHFTIINLLPQSVDETIVDHIMLLPRAPDSAAERAHLERAFAFMDGGVINAEDVWVAEQAQKTLHSGANDVMTFGKFEHQLKFFHDQLDAAWARSASPTDDRRAPSPTAAQVQG